MLFDKCEVLVGNLVYDLVFGSGTVEHINEAEKKIHVRYGATNRLFVYNENGVSNFPNKTLFWHDPVMGYLPMKDDKKWKHFCDCRDALAQVIWKSDSNAY